MDNPESKEIFQILQQAYEVLSDPHERAWYDRHRDQILHGSNSNYEDKSLDVYQYFTTQCYDGFEDSNPKNFYAVYAEVFSVISSEDIEYMDSSEDFETIPKFGNSKSDYLTVVEPFYAYFESYSTKKSYAWLFTHDINQIRDRKYLKIVEKENKKIQLKARKERNEEVRSLVLFVKKRDKRVQGYKKIVEEKLQQNRLKSQQNRLEQIKKRQEEIHAEKQKSKNHEHDSQLEELEKSYFNHYNDSDQSPEENGNDEEGGIDEDMENLELAEDQDLYCIACDKFFSNPSSFKNHEESKKHKLNVSLIKQEMQEEESNFAPNISDSNENYQEPPKKSKKGKKNKKKQTIQVEEHHSEPEEVEESEPKDLLKLDDSDKDDSWNDNKGNKKSKTKKSKPKVATKKENNIEPPAPAEKSQESEPKSEIDVNHTCVTCKKAFNSKNKLMAHLKETKHSVFLDKLSAKASKAKK